MSYNMVCTCTFIQTMLKWTEKQVDNERWGGGGGGGGGETDGQRQRNSNRKTETETKTEREKDTHSDTSAHLSTK